MRIFSCVCQTSSITWNAITDFSNLCIVQTRKPMWIHPTPIIIPYGYFHCGGTPRTITTFQNPQSVLPLSVDIALISIPLYWRSQKNPIMETTLLSIKNIVYFMKNYRMWFLKWLRKSSRVSFHLLNFSKNPPHQTTKPTPE